MVKEDLGFGKKNLSSGKTEVFVVKKAWVLRKKKMSFEKENLSLKKKDTVTLTGHRSFANYHFGHTKGKTSNSDEISYLSYSINFLTWNLIKSAEKERSFPLVIANIFGLCA